MAYTQHLRLFGHVQGVFFRESFAQKAGELGITGWIRNLSDGSLEATIQGTEANIDEMIKWARSGPELALVTRIEITEGSGQFHDFKRLQNL